MKYLKSIMLLTIALVTVSIVAMAQGPGFDDDVEDTPIDGGVTLIAVAAVGYGAKKLKDLKQNK